MIRYECGASPKNAIQVDTCICEYDLSIDITLCADIPEEFDTGVNLDRDSVAALVGQLTSWLERTKETDK